MKTHIAKLASRTSTCEIIDVCQWIQIAFTSIEPKKFAILASRERDPRVLPVSEFRLFIIYHFSNMLIMPIDNGLFIIFNYNI